MATDNRTIINDCEANTGWIGDDTAAVISDAGSFYQGSSGLSTQLSNANEQMHTTQDSVGAGTFNLDWSDSTLYLLVKDNLNASAASGGVQFVIGDAADLIGYDVGGFDKTGLILPSFYYSYKLDVSERVTTPGSFTNFTGTEANLDQTQITRIGYGSLHTAKAVGSVDNVVMDCFRYIANDSYALTIDGGTSGTPETMPDVIVDELAGGWGLVSNPKGSQYDFFGPFEIGTPSGTANSYFTASNQQWYLIATDIGATHFPCRTVGNSTGTNSVVLEGVAVVGIGTPAEFDLSDANMNIVKITGGGFTGLGVITMPVQSAGNRFCNGTAFTDCAKAVLQSLDMDGCIFDNPADADGAIIWDENTTDSAKQVNQVYKGTGGHAVHVLPVGAGPFTYNISGPVETGHATSDGSVGDEFFLCDSASDANITINVTDGSGNFKYMKAAGYTGTVTVNQSVTITLTCVEGATAIQGVNVIVGTTLGGVDVIDNLLTDVNGEVEVTYTGSTPQAVLGYAAKGSEVPTYKRADISFTIGASGATPVINMISDD